MTSGVIRLLGICDREWSRFISMGTLCFLLMVGWAFGNSASDAYFVKEVGTDQLPYAYMIKAVLKILLALAYGQIADRIARYRFLNILFVFFGSSLVLIRLLIPLGFGWLPYAVFALVDVITSILFMHFWIFANDAFNPREGKRIFPLIGGAGLIGATIGGALTQPLVSLVGTVDFLVSWPILMVFSIPLTLWAQKSAVEGGMLSRNEGAEDEEKSGFFRNFAQVWDIPLVRTITYLSFPLCWVYYIIEYQFYIALDEVSSGQDEMAGFLGIFNGIVSLAGFILQFFVTGRLLGRFGVGLTVLVHPVSVTVGSVALFMRSMLPIPAEIRLFSFRALSAVYAKFSDITIAYSIAESATNLLYNSIPEEKRGRARAFVAEMVELGTLSASALLILFALLDLHLRTISLLTIGMSISWVWLSWKLKSDYLMAMVKNLNSHSIELRSSAVSALGRLSDAQAVEILINSLSSPDENVALFSIERLLECDNRPFAGKFADALEGGTPRIRIALLNALIEIKGEDVSSRILPLLRDTDPQVRAAAARAIGQLGDPWDMNHLIPLFVDGEASVRAEALIALIRANANPESRKHAVSILGNMVEKEAESKEQAMAAYVIGETRLKEFVHMLLDLATSTDELVRREAIRAIGRAGNMEIIPPLLKLLDNRFLSRHIIDTFVEFGDPILDLLHEELYADHHTEGTKINIVHCLGLIGNLSSIPALLSFLDNRSSSAEDEAIGALASIYKKHLEASGPKESPEMFGYFAKTLAGKITDYLRAASRQIQVIQENLTSLQAYGNDKATGLLADALRQAGRRREELALRSLEMLGNPATIRAAAANLRHPERRTRSEALEVLEGSCPEARTLVKVLEGQYINDDAGHAPEPSLEIFQQVLASGSLQDLWPLACAIYGIGELKISGLKPALEPFCHEKEPLIRHNALLALKKMGTILRNHAEACEVDTMAINMERILFLRTVPLFADIDGSDLQWINGITKEKCYAQGEIIFEENAEGDALFIILSGSVRIIKGGESKVTLAVLEARDSFGEMAVLDKEPRSATAEVWREARLLVINRDDFKQLLLARPQIAFALFKSLSKRLREANARLMEIHRN